MAVRAVAGYSGLQITLHWIIAAIVAFQLIFGEGMTNVVDATEDGTPVSGIDLGVSIAHYWLGLAILALVLARLVLRLTRGVPPPTAQTAGWMEWAAKIVHWAFYVLLFAMPVLGLLTVYVNPDFGNIHARGKPVFIVLIAIHVLAALYHQFVIKDGTLRRILVSAR